MTDNVTVANINPGEWSSSFGNSLLTMFLYDQATHGRLVSHPGGWFEKSGVGAAGVVDGRNFVARSVVESMPDTDWVLFIDSDMGFDPDTADRLIAAADPVERPIVGALCFVLRCQSVGPLHSFNYQVFPTMYRLAETGDEIGVAPWVNYPRDQLVEVDATGAGCLLVHRSVLEAIGGDWFEQITVTREDGVKVKFGEDISFCLRAKAAGFRTFVDTRVKTSHYKEALYLTEEVYDAHRAARAVLAA